MSPACCDKLTVYPMALVVHCQLNPQARHFVSMPIAPKLIHRRGRWEEGGEHVSKHQLRSEKKKTDRAIREGAAEPTTRDPTRRRERGQGNEDRVKCHKGGTLLARKRKRRGRA